MARNSRSRRAQTRRGTLLGGPAKTRRAQDRERRAEENGGSYPKKIRAANHKTPQIAGFRNSLAKGRGCSSHRGARRRDWAQRRAAQRETHPQHSGGSANSTATANQPGLNIARTLSLDRLACYRDVLGGESLEKPARAPRRLSFCRHPLRRRRFPQRRPYRRYRRFFRRNHRPDQSSCHSYRAPSCRPLQHRPLHTQRQWHGHRRVGTSPGSKPPSWCKASPVRRWKRLNFHPRRFQHRPRGSKGSDRSPTR